MAKKTEPKKATLQKGEDQKPTWKKTTRGNLYPFAAKRNRRVKPNETIIASDEEIAKYRDQFELIKDGTGIYKVKSSATVKQAPAAKPQKEIYNLDPIGKGLYNVVSPAGKVMNDKGLSRDEAEILKFSLEEETIEE